MGCRNRNGESVAQREVWAAFCLLETLSATTTLLSSFEILFGFLDVARLVCNDAMMLQVGSQNKLCTSPFLPSAESKRTLNNQKEVIPLKWYDLSCSIRHRPIFNVWSFSKKN